MADAIIYTVEEVNEMVKQAEERGRKKAMEEFRAQKREKVIIDYSLHDLERGEKVLNAADDRPLEDITDPAELAELGRNYLKEKAMAEDLETFYEIYTVWSSERGLTTKEFGRQVSEILWNYNKNDQEGVDYMDQRDAQYIAETGLLSLFKIKSKNNEFSSEAEETQAEAEINQAISILESMRIKADIYDNFELYLINGIKLAKADMEIISLDDIRVKEKTRELLEEIKVFQHMLDKLQYGNKKPKEKSEDVNL